MNEDVFTNRKINFCKILYYSTLIVTRIYEYSIETWLLEYVLIFSNRIWNSFNLNLRFRINPNVSE